MRTDIGDRAAARHSVRGFGLRRRVAASQGDHEDLLPSDGLLTKPCRIACISSLRLSFVVVWLRPSLSAVWGLPGARLAPAAARDRLGYLAPLYFRIAVIIGHFLLAWITSAASSRWRARRLGSGADGSPRSSVCLPPARRSGCSTHWAGAGRQLVAYSLFGLGLMAIALSGLAAGLRRTRRRLRLH